MKAKKSKKGVSDRIGIKKPAKKINPFEVHINRKKHNVLGQKSKNERGLPGVARSKAISKRKTTLLQEYKLKGKSNIFVDRRIGEKDATMTADDRIIARYTAERTTFHSKKSLYNLDDNEVLTHRGESLADIEKFEDPKSDEEDLDDEGRDRSGKLGQDFVSEAHFGGGTLNKGQSRKDLIDQMIADSKVRKAEQQKQREETLGLTEKLDAAWTEIFPLVNSGKPKEKKAAETTLPSDNRYSSYDKLSKELIFESRGRATDKLKSVEQIAKEEKKRLDELEKQRLARMRGDITDPKPPKHRSADDLDDGFDYNDDGLGNKLVFGKEKAFDLKANEKKSNNLETEEKSDEGEESEDENEDEESGKEDDEGEKEGEEEVTDAEDTGDSEDDLSDLKESEDESEAEPTPVQQTKSATKKTKTPETPLEKALKDLPFTLRVPETFEAFSEMCLEREPCFQAVVLERMVKCSHPSLPDGSREQLINLFKYCLQHLHDTAMHPPSSNKTFQLLDAIAPWLYDLAQFAPAAASSALADVIKEKYQEFLKSSRKFPGIDTLVYFKLVSLLFPTSDFRHRVVTPTLVFMQHILATCRITKSTDVARGLMVATLLLEFTSVSKRLAPEVFNFLRGLLRSAQPDESAHPHPPAWKTTTPFTLRIPSTISISNTEVTPLGTGDLTTASQSDLFRARAVNLSLQLLECFIKNLQGTGVYLVVEPFAPLLDNQNYPECLQPVVSRISGSIQELKQKKMCRLQAEVKRPKPLRLYEPKIEQVYTLKRRRPMGKEKEELEKLKHKHKQAVKGALREIRRDNAFLSKIKFNETKAMDAERKRKVKQLFGDVSQEVADQRSYKRSKKTKI